jgi:hypothetical protein
MSNVEKVNIFSEGEDSSTVTNYGYSLFQPHYTKEINSKYTLQK